MTTITELDVVEHWLDGKSYAGSSTRTADVYDPAKGEVSRRVRLASKEDANHIIEATAAATWKWSQMSWARRQAVLFTFRELLESRKEELAEIITSEHGKTLDDALGEISRGQEVLEFALGMPFLARGGFSDNVSTGVDVFSINEPLGTVAIISPFNFPIMVPMWFLPMALATGNSVVLKPSEKDPSAAIWLADLLREAGLPDGVFAVLNGDKDAVDALLTHPKIQGISFVGSTPIARYVYETGTAAGKRVQALGGAKNHMLVLEDAELDLAAVSAINAGFGAAGERCMAISVLVVQESIADDLCGRIAHLMEDLVVGDGREKVDIGPLISEQHLEKVTSYIDLAENEGARIVKDGRQVEAAGNADGYWLGPSLIDGVDTSSAVYQDEIFGPVLTVMRVSDLEEGINLINGHEFGNGAAIFTNDGAAARRFHREVQAGMIGVNVPIPVPVSYYSFGGWKNSLFGDVKAHGEHGVRFFTREKTVTSRWPQKKQQASEVDLGFPTT